MPHLLRLSRVFGVVRHEVCLHIRPTLSLESGPLVFANDDSHIDTLVAGWHLSFANSIIAPTAPNTQVHRHWPICSFQLLPPIAHILLLLLHLLLRGQLRGLQGGLISASLLRLPGLRIARDRRLGHEQELFHMCSAFSIRVSG